MARRSATAFAQRSPSAKSSASPLQHAPPVHSHCWTRSALASLLAEGQSVLFLAPELQPLAPALAVEAMLEAGVPGDALALLFRDVAGVG